MSIRLEDPNAGVLELNAANGYFITRLDFGYPEVRAVVDSRPLADGTDDRSRFLGARVVTMELQTRGDRQTKMDELAPFLAPRNRPFLFFPAPEGERRVQLRPRMRNAAWEGPPERLRMILQWDAPNGTTETADLESVLIPAAVPVEPGIAFDWTFPLVFPAAGTEGATEVDTIGHASCPPVFVMHGPCTNPRIESLTDLREDGQPKRLRFDITLGINDTLTVDTRERTVKLNDQFDRYSTLDPSVSTWWTLLPGNNFIRFFPESFIVPSRVTVNYRCQFI